MMQKSRCDAENRMLAASELPERRERRAPHRQMDLALDREAEVGQTAATGRELMKLFEEIDVDQTGEISTPEFLAQLERQEVNAIINTLGIEAKEVVEVFSLLDRANDGTVEINKFVMGCMRLKGKASSRHRRRASTCTRWGKPTGCGESAGARA